MNISSYGFKSRPEYQAQNPCFYRGFRVFSLDFFNMKKDENATNEHRNGHRFFEFSMKKKRYSNPKIYIPRKNGRPSVSAKSRWHVYFYWRTEKDGPLDKLFTFRKDINRLTTPAERNAAAKSLQSALQVALDRGWNPLTNTTIKERSSRDSMLLKEALEFSYKILERTKSTATLNGYNFHLNKFLEWATINGYIGMDVRKFGVDEFYQFFDYLRFEYVNPKTGDSLSGTSINNTKRSLSSLFGTLKKERIIAENFVKDIPKVDQEPVNNKAFTLKELEQIKKAVLKEDPYLIHIIRFMMYPLLRVREICRLQVKDIDSELSMLKVKTKTEVLSYRRIIKKLEPSIKELKLENEPSNFHVFTNINQPKDWSDATLKSRTDHFGKRFKKIKDKLGFGREYGLYSFRHTAILDLYNSKVDAGLPEQQILFELMPITGHKSVAGIKNYLRHHKKSIPADHSDIYTIDI